MKIQITNEILRKNFRGVGFHVHDQHHMMFSSEAHQQDHIIKHWRELNPSFARVADGYKGENEEPTGKMIRRMKEETNTEVYLTTWFHDDLISTDDERNAYVQKTVDRIERLYREYENTNIKTYCYTNEMEGNNGDKQEWGYFIRQGRFDLYRKYVQAFYDEFKKRGLPIGMVTPDVSPLFYWPAGIGWATVFLDDLTEVYAGHEYSNTYDPKSLDFYDHFLNFSKPYVKMANDKGKDFMLGEFGSAQDGKIRNGKLNDSCKYWETPMEPYVGLQMCEFVAAGINAGMSAFAYWTFTDFPDETSPTYQNKWGLFRWSGEDYSVRDIFYCYGNVPRAFRSGSDTVATSSDDPLVHTAAVKEACGAQSLLVINRHGESAGADFSGFTPGLEVRRFSYSAVDIHRDPAGDLPDPDKLLTPDENGGFHDELPPLSVTVYTSRLNAIPAPSALESNVERTAEGALVRWNDGGRIGYTRVYRDGQKIFSTTAQSYLDTAPGKEYKAIFVPTC